MGNSTEGSPSPRRRQWRPGPRLLPLPATDPLCLGALRTEHSPRDCRPRHTVLAATDKCLAQSNKSRPPSKAT